MIRESGREDELVHPPVFTFAAWHQMRQHQTQQQTDAEHAAAVHEPLHDNGALFIIELQIRRIRLLLHDHQLVFQLLVLVLQRVNRAVTAGDFLLHIRRALVPDGVDVVQLIGQRFSLVFQVRDAGTQAGLIAQLFQRDPGDTAIAVAGLRITGAVVHLQHRHFFPGVDGADQTIIITRAATNPGVQLIGNVTFFPCVNRRGGAKCEQSKSSQA